MDNFLDVIIVRKNKGLFSLLYFFISLIMIIFALIGSIFLFQIMRPDGIDFRAAIIFVIAGGLAFLMFWLRGNTRIDYDISFTNGLVEIARVANNIKRKEIAKFYMKDVEVGEYTNSQNFNRYTSNKNLKRINVVLNRDEKQFYVVVKVKDAPHLVVMEANAELIALMKQYNPRNVKVNY